MVHKKLFILIIIILFMSSLLFSVEFGFLAGKNTEPSNTTLGFAAGMGLLIPMVKFEFELMKQNNTDLKAIGVGIKIRKKIGSLAPYVVIGAGTRFEKFSITFSNYDYYTYIGGGTHFYVLPLLSLRFDVRYQSYRDTNNVRLSVGAFAHL